MDLFILTIPNLINLLTLSQDSCQISLCNSVTVAEAFLMTAIMLSAYLFDTVDHEMLFHKSDSCGIRGHANNFSGHT